MSDILTALFVYSIPLVAAWAIFAIVRSREHARAVERKSAAEEAGLTEPASLHPVIDPALCLGCRSCVDACPEGEILGLVGGKAQLIDPTLCIGHGACRESCPQDAITLVLGTARRGVEIPHVESDFQTNVPGIYVAGELGGMGLIRNAIVQGKQAVDAIAKCRKDGCKGDSAVDASLDLLDRVIVGAGPAGIAASLRAKQLGLRFRVFDQDTLGGTVAHFPRGKIVMTAPVDLPLYGKVSFRETSKEALLELWSSVVKKTQLEIGFEERLLGIENKGSHKQVKTTRREYSARAVLLAIGRRGTPRKLGVAGEEQAKVVYRLAAPEQYRDQRVLVVGGGDSALEGALALAELGELGELGEEGGAQTALSYRGDAFSRAKAKNRERVEAAERSGLLQVLLSSQVVEIGTDTVDVETPAGIKQLANDAVIVCAGGLLPTPLLREAGIEIETKHGEV